MNHEINIPKTILLIAHAITGLVLLQNQFFLTILCDNWTTYLAINGTKQ